MAPKKTSKGKYAITPASWDEYPELFECAKKISAQYGIAFVLVSGNESFSDFWQLQARKPWAKGGISKVVILWTGSSIDPISILSWRSGLIEEGDIAYKVLLVPEVTEQKEWKNWLKEQLDDWAQPLPAREDSGLTVGRYVAYSNKDVGKGDAGYDPAFLTITPSGKMTAVLEQMDECKRLFRNVIGQNVGDRRANVLEAADDLFAFSYREKRKQNISSEILRITEDISKAIRKNEFLVDRNRIPRVLLLGPSGVGKTLVARYLAWRTSSGKSESKLRPFKRVPIPEYLHKEDNFEYDVFGYAEGAFTHAREGGSKGYLIERMGGVIFFDEIGEASPAIQAKLLAYLDDYQVVPRGWEGDPLFCPLLVVAATNRPIDEWANKEDESSGPGNYFRNDLFRRFNFIIHIPPLNERKDEIPHIIDAMMQMEAFNPKGTIKEVGAGALQAIQEIDYEKGNFRTLENLIRRACRMAAMDGRDYLVLQDIAGS